MKSDEIKALRELFQDQADRWRPDWVGRHCRWIVAIHKAGPGLLDELERLRESDARWSAFAEECGKTNAILEGQRDEARRERDAARAELAEMRGMLRDAHGLLAGHGVGELRCKIGAFLRRTER